MNTLATTAFSTALSTPASTAGAPAAAALLVLVLLPAVVGATLAWTRPGRRSANTASLATAAIALGLSVWAAVARPAVSVPFMADADFGMRVDGLAALVAPVVSAVTLLVLIFAVGDIKESQGRFHGLMLLFASSVSLTVTATTLPILLMAWEVMGATSYALIGFRWQEQHRMSAGLTAFLTTRAGDLGLYLAAGAALAGGSGLALSDLSAADDPWRQVAAAGIVVAALGKAAQLPFSFWLSRAMAGPSAVSALLHSAAMVAMGGYLLLRVQPLLATTPGVATATAWLGVASAVVLGVVALAQTDLKQLLAASTAAQLGFVVLAAGVGAVAGGAAHLVAHAATKALLFLAAGAWLTALGTKRLEALAGVAGRWPVVGWSATLGAVALAGIPPLSLWATKDAVLAAAAEHSVWLYAAGLAASVISGGYAGRIVVVIWRGERGADPAGSAAHLDEEEPGTRVVGWWQQAPTLVLAVGAVGLGVLALPPLAARLASDLGQPDEQVSAAGLVVGGALSLAALLAVMRWPVPRPGWALDWLGLERAAHATLVQPTMRLAAVLARFDDAVFDRAVERIAHATMAAGAWSARFDLRRVDAAVEAVAARTRALGRVARRPQTGQLHQYYLQSVAVLAVGLVLLLTVR
ncbi:NADH-quinone oxidoreductase subunit 5 family protein [Knoellia koreensis]|uniref:NADH-quinone oxidoreductase subunit L n=1 Tax=Knoellia koreensis TaxID=2730921 RepID=A0A849HTB4_9MICO|nr:proton-conducting transporter membrane subunit [Knoellia sp. DB2414S]NNM47817.1 NADH-quinone oxidoreductase subunit L [Knoellia sp. DB2414S]